MSEKTEQETPPKIEINETWCKGCAICVELCPKECLVMEKGIAVVVNVDTCTRCQLCDLRCPDFAIRVI